MNHEQVAQEWAEAYIKGGVAERWKITEACEENGTMAALVMLQQETTHLLARPAQKPNDNALA